MKRRRDLDRMVEAVLAGQPLPDGHLDADEAVALRAAIELRAARPGSDQPDEQFVTSLRRRIRDSVSEPPAPSGVPRRALLAGAAAAVAGGVIGAVAESELTSGAPARPAATGEIVPDDGGWVPAGV